MNPRHQLRIRNPQCIINRTIDPRGHYFFVVLKARPACRLALDQINLQSRAHRNLDCATRNFAIAHRGVSVAEIEQPSRDVHRKINCVAHRCFRRVHVAAEFRRDDRTARLSRSRRHANAPKKRMQRNLHFEPRIQRLKRRGVVRVIDRIKPNLLRQRRMQHRRVFRTIERSEVRAEFPDSLVSVHFQIEYLHHKRVSRLRAIDVKRPREGIVPLDQRHRVARLLDCIAETIQRICVEDICRFQVRDRRRRRVNVFHIVDRRLIRNGLQIRGLPSRFGSGHRQRKTQRESAHSAKEHASPQFEVTRVQHTNAAMSIAGGDYSSRSAAMGSSLAARCAGKKLATAATSVSATMASVRVSGSWGLRPYSIDSAARATASVSTVPTANPITSMVPASRMIMPTTSLRWAPSATRRPISLVRRATVYEITPYRPIVASTTARTPKKPDSVAINRSRSNESRI